MTYSLFVPAAYIIMNMVQTGLSLFLAIWILTLHHHSPQTPVPDCMKAAVFGCMAKMLCFKDTKANHGRDSPKVSPLRMNGMENQELGNDRQANDTKKYSSETKLPPDVVAYIRRLEERDQEREEEDSNRSDWERVGHIVDRFLLVFFLALAAFEMVFFITTTYYRFNIV